MEDATRVTWVAGRTNLVINYKMYAGHITANSRIWRLVRCRLLSPSPTVSKTKVFATVRRGLTIAELYAGSGASEDQSESPPRNLRGARGVRCAFGFGISAAT